MTLIFFILLVIACVLVGLVVLIQNPKGGGLSGSIAGFNNQFMGVKQTTDVLEKGTWIFISALAVLCIISILFISNPTADNSRLQQINTTPSAQPSNGTQQQQQGTFDLDTNKK